MLLDNINCIEKSVVENFFSKLLGTHISTARVFPVKMFQMSIVKQKSTNNRLNFKANKA